MIVQDRRGIVLVLVLWIITILMVIALSLSYLARTDLSGTIAFMRDMQNKYYALSGMERAKAELAYRHFNLNKEGSDIWSVDGTEYEYSIGNGTVRVRINNESSKIDINLAPEPVLKKLLMNQGITEEEAEGIVDSIMDWKDADDIPRPRGAEQDYYSSLPVPYRVKNGPFESVDELVYIKGMSKEILYGDAQRRGIIDLVTVNSGNRHISIKYAHLEVLKAIPGLSEEQAEAIAQRRQEREITSIQDIQDIVGDAMAEASRYFFFNHSHVFTIESEGRTAGSKAGNRYGIRAVVALEGINNFVIRYYKEPARVRD